MQLWTRGAEKLWRKAALSLATLLLIGLFVHIPFVPAHFRWTDLLILLPIAWCFVISFRAGEEIGFITRWVYGFLQSVLLIGLSSQHWAREVKLGDASEVYFNLGVMASVYSALFAVFPWLFSPQPVPPGDPMKCRTCGYNLTGNVSGLCPECGRVVGYYLSSDQQASCSDEYSNVTGSTSVRKVSEERME